LPGADDAGGVAPGAVLLPAPNSPRPGDELVRGFAAAVPPNGLPGAADVVAGFAPRKGELVCVFAPACVFPAPKSVGCALPACPPNRDGVGCVFPPACLF
jgi:hypothetical protein